MDTAVLTAGEQTGTGQLHVDAEQRGDEDGGGEEVVWNREIVTRVVMQVSLWFVDGARSVCEGRWTNCSAWDGGPWRRVDGRGASTSWDRASMEDDIATHVRVFLKASYA